MKKWNETEDVGPEPTLYAAIRLAMRTRPLHCATTISNILLFI